MPSTTILLLWACASEPLPGPPAEEPPPPPNAPEVFRLTGRAAHEGLLTPPFPEGDARLGPGCVAVNAELGGAGPPCLAERWTSDRREVVFLVANPAAALVWKDGPTVRARTRWTPLGAQLGWCLEDPLMVPPARDPQGTRTFTGAGWELRFSGTNRCALGGSLSLDPVADRADWSALTVAGFPWSAGGREHLRARLLELAASGAE